MEQKALKLIMAGLLILSMALTGREAAGICWCDACGKCFAGDGNGGR